MVIKLWSTNAGLVYQFRIVNVDHYTGQPGSSILSSRNYSKRQVIQGIMDHWSSFSRRFNANKSGPVEVVTSVDAMLSLIVMFCTS